MSQAIRRQLNSKHCRKKIRESLKLREIKKKHGVKNRPVSINLNWQQLLITDFQKSHKG